MKEKKRYITILHFLLTTMTFVVCNSFISCQNNDPDDDWSFQKETVVRLSITTPAASLPQSRSNIDQENLISNVKVLVLKKAGENYLYKYTAEGQQVSQTENTANFIVRLKSSTEPLKLLFVANVEDAFTSYTPVINTLEKEIRDNIIIDFCENPETGMPMYAEKELPLLDAANANILNIKMLRSIARVDVQVDLDENSADFTLESVYIYRGNNQVQVIPTAESMNMDELRVIQPSLTQNTTHLPPYGKVNETVTNLIQKIYLAETKAHDPDTEYAKTTCVVIGGYFNEDTKPTYYRADFNSGIEGHPFGQVLRNHRYLFKIRKVNISGWENPDDAAKYRPTGINVEIKVWDDNTTYMQYDDIYYFGVSTRTASVNPYQYATESILVDTNLDSYELFWSDEEGNINESIPAIKPGENFCDPDNIFTVSLSADGTKILIMANASNDTGKQIKRYIQAKAGRLRIQIGIRQDIMKLDTRPLKILGSRNEIGSLGDQMFGGSSSGGDRTKGLISILNNIENFGPQGIVPIEKVIRAANSSSADLPTNLFPLFDLLYLTYACNPSTTNCDAILDWLEGNEKRVLYVQCDNLDNTNKNMLNKLGLTYIKGSTSNPFTIHEETPDIFRYGTFGAVELNVKIRRNDDIYGTIEMQSALNNGYTPILVNSSGNMMFGVHLEKRIIICGDIDLHYPSGNTTGQERITGGGLIVNNVDKLVANTWAWIVSITHAQ